MFEKIKGATLAALTGALIAITEKNKTQALHIAYLGEYTNAQTVTINRQRRVIETQAEQIEQLRQEVTKLTMLSEVGPRIEVVYNPDRLVTDPGPVAQFSLFTPN